MMPDFPSLPLFTDAYLADTSHLTTEQHGAYMLLIIHMWRRADCALPLDHTYLAKITGVSCRRWPAMWACLKPFFTPIGDKFTQKRLATERDFVAEKSRKSSEAAHARWLKEKEKLYADASKRICPSDAPTPNPTPNPIEDSVPKGTAAKAAFPEPESKAIDPAKIVFDTGRDLLRRYGVNGKRAGEIIGGWRKQAPDADLARIIAEAGAAERADIVAFVQGCVRARASPKGGHVSKLTQTFRELAADGWKIQ